MGIVLGAVLEIPAAPLPIDREAERLEKRERWIAIERLAVHLVKTEVLEGMGQEDLQSRPAESLPLLLGRHVEGELGPPVEPVERGQPRHADELVARPRLEPDRVHFDAGILRLSRVPAVLVNVGDYVGLSTPAHHTPVVSPVPRDIGVVAVEGFEVQVYRDFHADLALSFSAKAD